MGSSRVDFRPRREILCDDPMKEGIPLSTTGNAGKSGSPGIG